MAHMFPVLLLAAAMTCEAPDGGPPPSECESESPIIEKAPPTRVILGVDCTKPLTISLPDDVLTECETE